MEIMIAARQTGRGTLVGDAKGEKNILAGVRGSA